MVFGGGIIPDDDIALLHDKGLAKIFTPGASLTDIADWVDAHLDGCSPRTSLERSAESGDAGMRRRIAVSSPHDCDGEVASLPHLFRFAPALGYASMHAAGCP